MIQKNGNWWHVPGSSSGRPGEYMREDKFPCERPIDIAVELCKQRRNAIDVGTWIGDSTKHMSALFDHVYGFEPHPRSKIDPSIIGAYFPIFLNNPFLIIWEGFMIIDK